MYQVYQREEPPGKTVRQTEYGITWNQIMCEGVTWAGLSENRISYI